MTRAARLPVSITELPLLATPRQAAHLLGLSDGQIRALIRAGLITHIMIGKRFRIPTDDIARFIAENKEAAMPRRNTGPKLRFLKKRNTWYVTWSEAGRSFERSTATANYKEAEIIFAEFLRLRQRRSGPRDPSEILISEVLTDYADERSSDIAAPMRLIYAVRELRKFWRNLTVADVTRETCRAYVRARGKSAGTARRELGVLRAAINHAHREGRITRTIAILLAGEA